LAVQPTDRKWGVASKADEYRRRAQVCLEMARTLGDRKWGVASKADEYRRRAQVCLEMARTFGDHNARVTLAHMAEVWTRLADKLDADQTIGTLKGGDEQRPAVQQQQQIQPKDD